MYLWLFADIAEKAMEEQTITILGMVLFRDLFMACFTNLGTEEIN